jgi:hypothetical protein
VKRHEISPRQRERIWTLIERGPDCWRWQGRHSTSGYAEANTKNHPRVHIVTYEDKYGSLAPGLVLDHFACNHRWCVNPDHVRPVTPRENRLRSDQWTLVTPAMRCKRGHDLSDGNLGRRPDGYPKCLACMREFQRAYLARKAARDAA